MRIVRLIEQDWPMLRRERLRALEDSPSAFWSELADEADQDEAAWRRFARAAAWFVALDGHHVLGLVAGLERAESPGEPELISLWVEPGARRRGVASCLLAAVSDWAATSGARELVLWVTQSNAAARQLYLAHGFAPTGETAPLPRDPTVLEHRLRARISAGPPALFHVPRP